MKIVHCKIFNLKNPTKHVIKTSESFVKLMDGKYLKETVMFSRLSISSWFQRFAVLGVLPLEN